MRCLPSLDATQIKQQFPSWDVPTFVTLVRKMETVCLRVLPTTYKPGFPPSQHSPDPAMEWGSPLLFPWINTVTICSLMCQVNKNNLFFFVFIGCSQQPPVQHVTGFEHLWEERWPGRKILRATLDFQVLDTLHSQQNNEFLNSNWETKGNFKERSQKYLESSCGHTER